MKVWSPDELGRFLTEIDGEPHAPMLRLAALSGLRRGELCGLRWPVLDLDGDRLTVSRTLLAVHGLSLIHI